MIKQLIKYCDLILEFLLRETVYNKIRKKSFDNIFVFDLDNTIVNTWDSYNFDDGAPKFLSFFSIYKKANAYPEMINLINSIHSNNNIVIFLTARNSIFFRSTKIWLENHLSIEDYNLILVNSASRKINIIDTLSKIGDVYYYDDLTYGHEFGKVIHHEKIIEKIKTLPITYFDYNYIAKFNSSSYLKNNVSINE
jgi:hypothetical protein